MLFEVLSCSCETVSLLFTLFMKLFNFSSNIHIILGVFYEMLMKNKDVSLYYGCLQSIKRQFCI